MTKLANTTVTAAVAAALGLLPHGVPGLASGRGLGVAAAAPSVGNSYALPDRASAENAADAVAALLRRSQQAIVADIEAGAGSLTRLEVARIINEHLARTLEGASNDPSSGVRYDPNSGRLIIQFDASAVETRINLRKLSHDLAAPFMVCGDLGFGDVAGCARSALSLTRDLVRNQLLATARGRAK